MKRLFLLLLIALLSVTVSAQDAPLKVVATTSIIADVARNVGGDLVEVTSLVPPNSDVHAFQPTPEDAVLVAEADVLLVNGAGLEAFLGDLLENAAVEPFVVSNGIEMLPFHGNEEVDGETLGTLGEDDLCKDELPHNAQEAEEAHERRACDPHVWTNPRNVKTWVLRILAAFAIADPDNTGAYIANAYVYIQELERLDTDIEEILSVIPEERRILVTNHEFLTYFADAYDFEIIGIVVPGGTTLAEPDPQELANLIAVIEAEGVPAIFAEVSASAQLAEVVAAETGITVVTTLYSDSLSDSNGPAGTYLDYMRYNAQTIADALAG